MGVGPNWFHHLVCPPYTHRLQKGRLWRDGNGSIIQGSRACHVQRIGVGVCVWRDSHGMAACMHVWPYHQSKAKDASYLWHCHHQHASSSSSSLVGCFPLRSQRVIFCRLNFRPNCSSSKYFTHMPFSQGFLPFFSIIKRVESRACYLSKFRFG